VKKPKWVLFCEELLNKGYVVVLYQSHKTNSKYITLIKNNKMLKIRYADHVPNYTHYCNSEIKLYVGSPEKGMLSEGEVFRVAEIYFRSRYIR